MFCNVCCHARMKNSFTTGCTNFQHSALVKHIDIHGKGRAAGQHLQVLEIVNSKKMCLIADDNQGKKKRLTTKKSN